MKKVKVKKFKVKAFEIVHPYVSFFIFPMNAKDLLSIATVNARDEMNPEKGTQRILREKRLKEIGEFLSSKESLVPNSIVISLKDAEFRKERTVAGISHGTLIIPKVQGSAWIVDGQHRLFAFTKTTRNLDLIVTAFRSLPLKKQAEIFITINRTQQKVNSSLVYDMLDITRKEDKYYSLRCSDIIRELREDPKSPWYNNVKRFERGRGYSLTSFVRNLKELIKKCPKFKELTLREQTTLLKDFFKVVAETFPNCWMQRGYVLTKTLGVGALIKLYIEVFNSSKSDEELTYSKWKKKFEKIKTFNFSSKKWGPHSGHKGQIYLKDKLMKAMVR